MKSKIHKTNDGRYCAWGPSEAFDDESVMRFLDSLPGCDSGWAEEAEFPGDEDLLELLLDYARENSVAIHLRGKVCAASLPAKRLVGFIRGFSRLRHCADREAGRIAELRRTDSNGTMVLVSKPGTRHMVRMLSILRSRRKRLQRIEMVYRDVLGLLIGHHLGFKGLCEWRPSIFRKTDFNRLKKDYPEVYEEVVSENVQRSMLLLN